MATNKTDFLGLNQWVHSDGVLMEDFNRDNQILERVLTPLVQNMVWGSYTATGIAGHTVELGFKPRILILAGYFGVTGNIHDVCTLLFGDYIFTFRHDINYNEPSGVELTDTGFQVTGTYYHNIPDKEEHYLAIR